MLFDHREGETCSWNADGGPASRIYNTDHHESTLSQKGKHSYRGLLYLKLQEMAVD